MQPLQTPIINSILYCVTYDVVQRCWIEKTVLIFSVLDIKIVTDGSYPILLSVCAPKLHKIFAGALLLSLEPCVIKEVGSKI